MVDDKEYRRKLKNCTCLPLEVCIYMLKQHKKKKMGRGRHSSTCEHCSRSGKEGRLPQPEDIVPVLEMREKSSPPIKHFTSSIPRNLSSSLAPYGPRNIVTVGLQGEHT